MTTVDTNIVVRLLVNEDDAGQRAAAERAMRSGRVVLLRTVLLETGWVLRSAYGFSDADIARGLRLLVAMDGVEVEDGEMVARALDWFEEGLDFADAMHLAAAGPGAPFLSFDKALVRRSAQLRLPVRVREP